MDMNFYTIDIYVWRLTDSVSINNLDVELHFPCKFISSALCKQVNIESAVLYQRK